MGDKRTSILKQTANNTSSLNQPISHPNSKRKISFSPDHIHLRFTLPSQDFPAMKILPLLLLLLSATKQHINPHYIPSSRSPDKFPTPNHEISFNHELYRCYSFYFIHCITLWNPIYDIPLDIRAQRASISSEFIFSIASSS